MGGHSNVVRLAAAPGGSSGSCGSSTSDSHGVAAMIGAAVDDVVAVEPPVPPAPMVGCGLMRGTPSQHPQTWQAPRPVGSGKM